MKPVTTTRRAFGGRFAAALSALVLSGCALPGQRPTPTPKVHRIGYLGSDSRPGFERFAALIEGLRELGYVEGNNLVIERRLSQDQTGSAFAPMAAELVASGVQVIVTSGTPPVVAAANATRSIPIVAGGPHRALRDLGVVTDLAHPTSNVTGLDVDPGMESKRVELLHQVVPRGTRFGLLRNPATPGTNEQLARAQEAAASLGLELIDMPVPTPADVEPAIDRAAQRGVDGVIVYGDFVFGDPSGWRVGRLAVQRQLPAMYTQTAGYVDEGGLMSYAADYNAFHHRAATFVDKLLRGATPAQLPVEQVMLFEFSVNLSAARAMNVVIPRHVLLQATRTFE